MSTKKAYRALGSDKSDEAFTESDYSDEDGQLTGNNRKKKDSILIAITLSTAVLALVVALVSVVLSTAFNSNSGLTVTVGTLELRLNQSMKAIEYLGNQISTDQTEAESLYKSLKDLLNEFNSEGSISKPATSCSEIPTDRPSGEYWILKNSSPVQVYCDMTRTCCNTAGGWMRVANIDMTDSDQRCPVGFSRYTRSKAPRHTCGRSSYHFMNCTSTTFPVHGVQYSRICGRVIGYQFGSTEAFSRYHSGESTNVIQNFVDGVILTHNGEYIWTFAAAHDEKNRSADVICPCTRSDHHSKASPRFIGNDYFCDTGSRTNAEKMLYSDDPLWDGQGCGGTSTCCTFNNPPWFCKELRRPTTDDIKLTLCLGKEIRRVNIVLEQVDIFVH